MYAFSLYMYFYFKEDSILFTFLILILFITNIVDTLFYYSSYLPEDKTNIGMLRIIIGTRLVTFLGMNFFRLIPGFGVLDSIVTYIFILYISILLLAIYYFDKKIINII